jgi:hypothetical protein
VSSELDSTGFDPAQWSHPSQSVRIAVSGNAVQGPFESAAGIARSLDQCR